MTDKDEQIEEMKASEAAQEEGAAAEEENVDANVFNQQNELVETVDEQRFTCTHPQDRGGHIVYKCKGMDD